MANKQSRTAMPAAAEAAGTSEERKDGPAPGVLSLAKAVALHLRGDREGALKELDQALQDGASTAELHAARGHLQLELQRFEEAALSYAKVLETQPADPKICFNLGLCLQNRAKHIEALEQFEKALASAPGWVEARLSIGISTLHLKRYPEAIEILDECLRLQPDCEAALFGKAVALQLLGKFDDSRAVYERILEWNSASEESLLNMISLGLQQKDYELLRKRSQQLLDLRPGHPVAMEGLAAAAFASATPVPRRICV